MEAHQDLAAALDSVEQSGTWTCPRMILDAACVMAGIQPERWIESSGKRVALFAGFVAKAGTAGAISANVRLCDHLGSDAAKVFEHGRCWMIQERVDPIPAAPEFAKAQRKKGAGDIRGNTGRRRDGTLAAFDGFIIPPKRHDGKLTPPA